MPHGPGSPTDTGLRAGRNAAADSNVWQLFPQMEQQQEDAWNKNPILWAVTLINYRVLFCLNSFVKMHS